jgi:hypothetical protein
VRLAALSTRGLENAYDQNAYDTGGTGRIYLGGDLLMIAVFEIKDAWDRSRFGK